MSQLSPDEREELRDHISSSPSSGGDFLLSAAVGFATGSGVIGGLVGGSLLGGIFGDEMEGSDDSIF